MVNEGVVVNRGMIKRMEDDRINGMEEQLW
jgi:hypothetical protein